MYVAMSELERGELLADLRATSWPGDRDQSALAWSTRPSILRRAASSIAELINADADRIVVKGPAAESLGTAVSLASGLQFTVVHGGENTLGELQACEQIAVISFFSDFLTRDVLTESVRAQSIALFGSEAGLNGKTIFTDQWDETERHQVEGGQHD